MSEDPGSNVKKPMEPSSLLEAIFIFIGSLLFKAIEYLIAFTHIFHKSPTAPKSKDGPSRPSLPKSFSDMPVDVVSLIVKRLNYKEQLKLRKVSKSLRALVDNLKPECQSVTVGCLKKAINIKRNYIPVAYTSSIHYNAFMRYKSSYEIVVLRDDFKKAAFDDLISTLKNPKLRLNEFIILFAGYDDEDVRAYYNNLQYALEPLNHLLSVKKVVLDVLSPSNLLSILPFLKPGFLENISIWLDCETRKKNWRIDSTGMDQLALLDQWKQAEELELLNCFDRFPLEYATHFKRLRFSVAKTDGDMLSRIKNFLSKLDNFEHCILSCYEFSNDPDSVYELLGAPVSSNATEEVFHHPIPDSHCFFEIKKSTDSMYFYFHITKKKRESNR